MGRLILYLNQNLFLKAPALVPYVNKYAKLDDVVSENYIESENELIPDEVKSKSSSRFGSNEIQ